MKIANPIYDVVFKYLMSDTRIARFLISKIIGEEVVSINVKPTEFSTKVENDVRSFTVFHLDFSAIIQKTDGTQEQVLIEVQKAKLPTDIMRFRRYLGTQYQDSANYYTYDDKGQTRAYPIKTIYFLGHKLDHLTRPFVKVERDYYDGYSNEKLHGKENFIESLTHDSFIIQIPFLHEKRKNELSRILSLFDQSQCMSDDQHFLEITENDYPSELDFLVRKLREAAEEPEVCKVMRVEDEILTEFANLERIVEIKNEVIVEKDQVIAEKDQVLAEKDGLIARQQEILSHAIEQMVNCGFSREDAEKMLSIPYRDK